MKQFFSLIALCIASLANAQTFTSWTTADGLASDDVRDVALDSDGNIWLATAAGVATFDGSTFTVHNTTTHPGLASNDITAIAVMSNGDVWAGTDFGASRFDGSNYTTYTTADGLGDNQVKNIKQAPNGDIWFATINGATKYVGGIFTEYTTPNIPFGGAQHVAFDGSDVWFSGGLGGAIKYDGSAFTPYTTAAGLLSNRIRSIALDASQNKWIGTSDGISVLNAANVHTLDHPHIYIMPPPDELNPITDVVIDNAGRIWAGIYVDYLVTVGGVSVYSGGTWTQFDEADGVAGPNVRRLAVDADGDVWVTTSTGITEISDINIGIAEQERKDFVLYPNPASSVIDVVLNEVPSTYTNLEVRDAMGRLVIAERITTLRAQVDVSGLVAGLYHARIDGRVTPFVVAP